MTGAALITIAAGADADSASLYASRYASIASLKASSGLPTPSTTSNRTTAITTGFGTVRSNRFVGNATKSATAAAIPDHGSARMVGRSRTPGTIGKV